MFTVYEKDCGYEYIYFIPDKYADAALKYFREYQSRHSVWTRMKVLVNDYKAQSLCSGVDKLVETVFMFKWGTSLLFFDTEFDKQSAYVKCVESRTQDKDAFIESLKEEFPTMKVFKLSNINEVNTNVPDPPNGISIVENE
jgi:hypothetical protein